MNYKIVADSSANITALESVPFASVPLHIIVGEQTFADDEAVDIPAMQEALKAYKGKTSTACPSPEDWITAFGDAEAVFCVTITSGLSGAYSSAAVAKQIYEDSNPGRRVYVFDSLSTGPEMALIVEKLQELICSGAERDDIERETRLYMQRTRLFFALASLQNFAKNGRINPLIAKGIGVLGLRIIGTASEQGQLKPLDKKRGDAQAYDCMVQHMREAGYCGGRVIITHTDNPGGAEQLRQKIAAAFGSFNGYIAANRALCSYYAEPQSVLLGFASGE